MWRSVLLICGCATVRSVLAVLVGLRCGVECLLYVLRERVVEPVPVGLTVLLIVSIDEFVFIGDGPVDGALLVLPELAEGVRMCVLRVVFIDEGTGDGMCGGGKTSRASSMSTSGGSMGSSGGVGLSPSIGSSGKISFNPLAIDAGAETN